MRRKFGGFDLDSDDADRVDEATIEASLRANSRRIGTQQQKKERLYNEHGAGLFIRAKWYEKGSNKTPRGKADTQLVIRIIMGYNDIASVEYIKSEDIFTKQSLSSYRFDGYAGDTVLGCNDLIRITASEYKKMIALLIAPKNAYIQTIGKRRDDITVFTYDSHRWSFIERRTSTGEVTEIPLAKAVLDGEFLGTIDYGYSDKVVINLTNNNKKDNKMRVTSKENNELYNSASDLDFIGSGYSLALVTADEHCTPEVFKIDTILASTVAEGNCIVVEYPNGYATLRVSKILPNTLENATYQASAHYWVVNKVDETDHLARATGTQRHKWLLSQLEEKKKALDSYQMFEILSKYDDGAAKMIEELKELSGVVAPVMPDRRAVGNTTKGTSNA